MPPQKPNVDEDSQSPREKLATGLRRLRAESGMSLRELSAKTGWDHTHLHAMEQGKSLGGPDIIEALDTVYGTTPMLKLMWQLAKEDKGAFREKYQRYMDLEAKSRVMQQFSSGVIPGLLQTEAYAREALKASGLVSDDLEEQVFARLNRQSRLTDDPCSDFRVILDEAVLRHALPSTREWCDQLAHLVTMAARPNVTIQMLPFDSGLHRLIDTDTMFLWLPNGGSVAYIETGYTSDLVEDPEEVEPLRLAYDHLRDRALSPRDSVAFIEKLVENLPCDPPDLLS